MEFLISNLAIIITIIGGLVFLTSLITQVTKGINLLNKIPTALQVLATSILLSILTVVIYIQTQRAAFLWYYIVGAILLGFIVAFISTYGWDQLYELWNRSNNKAKTNITTDQTTNQTKENEVK